MKKLTIGLLLGIVLCFSSVQEVRADFRGIDLMEACEKKVVLMNLFALLLSMVLLLVMEWVFISKLWLLEPI